MSKLTADDAAMLEFFYSERGDMSRWVEWDRVKPLIRKEYPEVLDALERLNVAERTLDAVVNKMVETISSNYEQEKQ